MRIINNSKTFVLNKERGKEDEFSTLSMYTDKQEDIFNILPVGIKYDIYLSKHQKLKKFKNEHNIKTECISACRWNADLSMIVILL